MDNAYMCIETEGVPTYNSSGGALCYTYLLFFYFLVSSAPRVKLYYLKFLARINN